METEKEYPCSTRKSGDTDAKESGKKKWSILPNVAGKKTKIKREEIPFDLTVTGLLVMLADEFHCSDADCNQKVSEV